VGVLVLDQAACVGGFVVVDARLLETQSCRGHLRLPVLGVAGGGELGDLLDDLVLHVAGTEHVVAAAFFDQRDGAVADHVGQRGVHKVATAPRYFVDASIVAASVPDPGDITRVVVKGDLAVLGAEGSLPYIAQTVEDLGVIAQPPVVDAGVAGGEPTDGKELVDQIGVLGHQDAPGRVHQRVEHFQRAQVGLRPVGELESTMLAPVVVQGDEPV